MPMTSAAAWLNEFFSGYDSAILSFMHSLASAAGGVLNPLMKAVTFLGEKGIIFFLLALIFMCFASERDTSVCVFGAVCCGALITNIILKDSIARPRPFESVDQFRDWWIFVGSPFEDGFSFPSGHVTAAAAGMTALSLIKGKKLVVPSVIVVLLMAVSRNYLMAHYPSDVLVAAVIGVASGFIAWVITRFIFRFLEDRRDSMPLAELVLDFDIRELLPFELPFTGAARASARTAGDAGQASVRRTARHDADSRAVDGDARRSRASAEDGRGGGRAAEPQRRRTSAGGKHLSSSASRSRFTLPGTYRGKHEKR